MEIDVQKVLYGHAPIGKPLRFQWPWDASSETPQIFALAPTVYATEAPWEYRYSLDLSDEKSQVALAAARLDYHVLSSISIFIGIQAKTKDDQESGDHTVVVQRVLAGTGPGAGDTVVVEIGGPGRGDDAPRFSTIAQIYLIGHVFIDKETQQTRYRLGCRQPLAQEQAIRGALKRRNDYPVVEVSNKDAPAKVREILFRGSIAEAIDLLGAESEAAAELGADMLLHNRQTALDSVYAAAEQNLFVQVETKPGTLRRQRRLIRIIHSMAMKAEDNQVVALLRKYLEYLDSNPPTPPPLPARGYWGDQDDNGNRSLCWLLQEMDREQRRKIGERLLKLRSVVTAEWKSRIQDALDEVNLEDDLALIAQLERCRNVQSKRSQQGFFQDDRYVVAFSPDGRLLATVGRTTRIWDTSSWKKLSEFEQRGWAIHAQFSPDNRHLYIAGGVGFDGGGLRFDWRTGKADPMFSAHHAGVEDMSMSADATIMATTSRNENKRKLWNTGTGALLRSTDSPGVHYHLSLSPDGKILMYETGEQQWQAEFVPTGTRLGETLKAHHACFSPDGRYLVTIQKADPYAEKPTSLVEVREPNQPFKLISAIELSAVISELKLAFSPSSDNQRLAIFLSKPHSTTDIRPDLAVAILSLSDSKPVCSIEIQAFGRDILIDDLAFSQDGKTLAVAKGNSPPLLFDATTGERLVPTPDYQPNISDVHFSADGGTLITVSPDTICTWDTQTLKQKTRVSLPANHEAVCARPDGKYVLCRNATADKSTKVLESATGRHVCDVAIEPNLYNPKVIWLNDHEALNYVHGSYWQFNYLTGNVVRECDLKKSGAIHHLASSDELLLADYGIKTGRLEFSVHNLTTGNLTREPGVMKLPRFTGNYGDMVPGGRYYCVTDPGFHLCEWRTLTLVASRPLTGSGLIRPTFSADGSRYVLFGGGDLRVYETLSGRMVCAYPASFGSVTFSPDGKQLALVNRDSTLVVWPILDDTLK